jgi:hypothetical protein
MLFPTWGRVYVWRASKECLVPTVKRGGGSVVGWAAISWYSVGPIITLCGQITSKEYMDSWVIRCILWSNCYFWTTMQFSKKTMLPFTQLELFNHDLKSKKGSFNIFPGQHSPRLDITEPLCSVLESRMRNRFPPPTSLKQLEDVLQVEWCKILLETDQNLYESIPRRIVSVLKTNGGLTPY